MAKRTKDTIKVKPTKKKPSVRVQTTRELRLKAQNQTQTKTKNIPENTREVRRVVNGKVQVLHRPTTYKKREKYNTTTIRTSRKKVHTKEELSTLTRKQLQDRIRYLQNKTKISNDTIRHLYGRGNKNFLDWNDKRITNEQLVNRLLGFERTYAAGGLNAYRHSSYITSITTGLGRQSSILANQLLRLFDSLTLESKMELLAYMEEHDPQLLTAWLEGVIVNYTGELASDRNYYDLIIYIQNWITEQLKGGKKMEELVEFNSWLDSLIERAKEHKYNVIEDMYLIELINPETYKTEGYVPIQGTEEQVYADIKQFEEQGYIVQNAGYVTLDILEAIKSMYNK